MRDEYYIVETETQDIESPWIRSAWIINSFSDLDEAKNFFNELCSDIVNLAKEHKENGDYLEDVCILRVVEDENCLRIEEEVVAICKYERNIN